MRPPKPVQETGCPAEATRQIHGARPTFWTHPIQMQTNMLVSKSMVTDRRFPS